MPSARRHRDALVDGYVSGNLCRGRVVKLLKTTLSSDCFLVSVKTCCVMGMDGCRAGHDAVLAERLRRTLKARVRKSVGSIPTDCIDTTFFACSLAFRLILFGRERRCMHTSAYSSVGRAGDCSWLQLISLGHWFDSGCPDLFFRHSFFSFICPLTAALSPALHVDSHDCVQLSSCGADIGAAKKD